MNNTIGQILRRKGPMVYSVTPETHVIDALHLMEDNNIGSLVVFDKGQYMGIMTERDYSRKVVTKGKRSISTYVKDIMTTDLPSVSESDSIDKAMELITAHNQRYLPVKNGSDFVGIISIMDLVKEKLIEQNILIESLTNHIRNSY